MQKENSKTNEQETIVKDLEQLDREIRVKQQELSQLIGQVRTKLSDQRHYSLKTIEDKKEYKLTENLAILREDQIREYDDEIYSKLNKVQNLIKDITHP